MHQKSILLVALSALLPHCAAAAHDKHKQANRPAKARRFVARAYCTGRVTSLGKKPEAGRTIAADPKLLPLGSHVLISGAGRHSGEYHVSDVGGKVLGNAVDIYVRNRQEAIEFGRKNIQLTVLHTPKYKAVYGKEMPCPRCNSKDPDGIIAVDAASRSNRGAGRAVAAGEAGTDARYRDSWQGGSTSLVSRLSPFQGTPAY